MSEEKKQRRTVITFIYQVDASTKSIKLVSSEVSEASVSAAWARVSREKGISGPLLGAIRGERELLEDQLRKPTYAELQQQLSELKAQKNSR